MPQDKPLQAELDTIRIPIMGEMSSLKSVGGYSISADYFNCYPEIFRHPSTGEESYQLARIPEPTSWASNADMPAALVTALGLTKANLSAVAHMAMSQVPNCMIAVWIDNSSGTMYVMQHSVESTTTVLIGSIARLGAISAANSLYDTVSVSECQIANAGIIYPGITVVRTAYNRSLSKSYHARASATTFTATTLTQIVDVDFPDQLGTALCVVGPIIQMNGIFYALTTTGVIYGSGGATGTANDPSTWTSTAIIQTYQDPDQSVSLARYKHHILVFGTNSVEFFNDEGIAAPANRLGRTEQAAIRFGTISSKTILYVNDTLYWLSSGRNNTVGLWKMDGYEPLKISTPREDIKLSGARAFTAPQDGVSLFCLSMAGKVHIGVNGVQTKTLALLRDKDGVSGGTGMVGQNSRAQTMASGVMLFNTADKVWWNMMVWPDEDSDGAKVGWELGILPVNPYLSPEYSSEYVDTTMLLYTRLEPSDTTAWDYLALTGQIINPGPNWGDYSDSGTNWPRDWPMIIQFNPMDFGNHKRKRVHKAEMVFAKLLNPNYNTSGVYITFMYSNIPTNVALADWATGLTENGLKARELQIPGSSGAALVNSGRGNQEAGATADPLQFSFIKPRYYVNNLGMGRSWSFGIFFNGTCDFPLTSLDLTVSQCTS